ncbi:ComF family protein [Amorphus sp. 3PC139-8]
MWEGDPDLAAPPERRPGDSFAALVGSARRGGRMLLDLVVPPICASCRMPVADQTGLCSACWSKLALIERPYCERLGIPFAYDLGPGALSAEAIAAPPPFERSRAVARYDDIARRLVHALKYRNRQETAILMGRMMARAGQEILADTDLIVPIPLHRTRLLLRGFNQSAALAKVVARETNRPLSLDGLLRVRATRHQVGLSAQERESNVRGAFRIRPEAAIEITGRRLLLVDDVFTSGATVTAAVRALKRAGAASVDVLVFARVVGKLDQPI